VAYRSTVRFLGALVERVDTLMSNDLLELVSKRLQVMTVIDASAKGDPDHSKPTSRARAGRYHAHWIVMQTTLLGVKEVISEGR
jgi:hypothetical protein